MTITLNFSGDLMVSIFRHQSFLLERNVGRVPAASDFAYTIHNPTHDLSVDICVGNPEIDNLHAGPLFSKVCCTSAKIKDGFPRFHLPVLGCQQPHSVECWWGQRCRRQERLQTACTCFLCVKLKRYVTQLVVVEDIVDFLTSRKNLATAKRTTM